MAYVFYPENYLNQNAKLQAESDNRFMQQQQDRQAMALRAAAEQRAAQNQQFSVQDKQRQNLLEDQARQAAAGGDMAAMKFLQSMQEQQQPAGPPMQGPMPNGQTMQGAAIGPNVRPTDILPPQQTMQNLTVDRAAQSIMKQSPGIKAPELFAALDRLKPMMGDPEKMKLEQLKNQHETELQQLRQSGAMDLEKMKLQNLPPESAAGKIAYDKRRGLLPTDSTGKLKITELPDAQSRKAAIEYQKAIETVPDLQQQFAKAKELNADSFDSGAVGADWKVLATRKASALAPLFGMTEQEAKDAMVATTKYEQLIKTTIIPRLRATFGGRVTNFETQFMNDIEGKVKMSKAERDALIDQSLDFISQSEDEARGGLDALGVQINEPKPRESKTMDFSQLPE